MAKKDTHPKKKRESHASRVEKTRAIIIKAAFELMSKNGVAATSIQDIAKRSKTSHPLVTYHFKTIDDVYFGVVQQIIEETRIAAAEAIRRPHEKQIDVLRAYSDAYFIWGKKNTSKLSLWMYFNFLCSFKEEYLKFGDEIRKIGRERITSILTRGIALDEFPRMSSQDIDDLSFAIQGLLTGNLVMTVSETHFPLEEAQRITALQIERMVLGRNGIGQ